MDQNIPSWIPIGTKRHKNIKKLRRTFRQSEGTAYGRRMYVNL